MVFLKGDTATYNNEGKNWILPIKNIRTALEIYQPAGWKGKLIKAVLPYIAPIGIVPVHYSVVSLDDEIPDSVLLKIREIFGENVEYSYFAGTPGTHKKPTVQVFKGNKILGYVKYTSNQEIASLFRNEEQILGHLKTSSVNRVPVCLYCGNIDNITVFVQNTRKKVNAKTVHVYGKKHEKFLLDLKNRTVREIPFINTDFSNMLDELMAITDRLSKEDQRVVNTYIQKTRDFHKDDREYSVCHRDFTPWNTCIVEEELYVFDWEYARMSYPIGLDKARFIVEVERREKHKTVKEIVRSYRGDERILMDYLLDNLYIYLKRGQESDRENIEFNLNFLKALL